MQVTGPRCLSVHSFTHSFIPLRGCLSGEGLDRQTPAAGAPFRCVCSEREDRAQSAVLAVRALADADGLTVPPWPEVRAAGGSGLWLVHAFCGFACFTPGAVFGPSAFSRAGWQPLFRRGHLGICDIVRGHAQVSLSLTHDAHA